MSEQTPHDRHVAAGGCPSIANTKAWCNLDADHPGNHMAPYLLNPQGDTRPLFWTDDDPTPRPI